MNDTAELVLCAAEQVPPGKVVSYGVIARLVGTSARRVGTVMSTLGGQVPWWRVTNVRGELPKPLLELARKRWQREGIEHNGQRALIERHEVDVAQLAADYLRATSDIAG